MSGDTLDTSAKDRAFAIANATLTSIPLAGPFITELVKTIIPNQRMDRVADFIHSLEIRLEQIESSFQATEMSVEKTKLFEEGAYQSVKAISQRRIHIIATTVADGFAGTSQDAIVLGRMLRILENIDDEELKYLESFIPSHNEKKEFFPGQETQNHDQIVRDSLQRGFMLRSLVSVGLIEEKPYLKTVASRSLSPGASKKSQRLEKKNPTLTKLGWSFLEALQLYDPQG